MKSFVKSNPSYKWCPNPFCTKAIKVGRVNENENCSYIKCDCGHAFCFDCEALSYAPVTRELLQKWNTKRQIERLASHEDESKKKEPRSPDLRRFMLYYASYNDHQELLQEERKLYENLVTYETQDQKVRFVDIPVLKNAVDIVHQCRLTVMHICVFEYYVDHSKLTEMFFKNRNELQAEMNRLSGLLRKITTLDKLLKDNTVVKNLCAYTQSLRRVLIYFVNEGFSKRAEDGGCSLNEE